MPMGWGGLGPPPGMPWPTTAPARPKPARLVTNPVLRGKVEAGLATKDSSEQIAGRLKVHRQPASANRSPGRSRLVAVSPWSTYAIITNP